MADGADHRNAYSTSRLYFGLAEYDSELSKIVAELNRAAPSQKAAARTPQASASLQELLHFAGRRGASDILLVAGVPAILRVNGALASGSGTALQPDDVRAAVLPLLDAAQLEELQRRKAVDFGFERHPQ